VLQKRCLFGSINMLRARIKYKTVFVPQLEAEIQKYQYDLSFTG